MIRSKTAIMTSAVWFGAMALAITFWQTGSRADQPDQLAPVPDFSSTERSAFQRAAVNGTLGDDAPQLLPKAAKYYVNRLTQAEYQQPHAEGSPLPTMDQLVQEAVTQIIVPPSVDQPLNDNQQAFQDEYAKYLLVELQNVLKNPKAIARVNAARILARLGRAGVSRATDLMVTSIDPKNQQLEAVKFWCFRGLKDLLIYGKPKEDQRNHIVTALMDYITAPHKPPQHPLPGEVDAIHYVRREAVRALAQWHIPADDNGKMPAALVLMRVMAADGLTPPPSLTERVAAAEGLCRMQSRKYDRYQPEYAARQVGYFVADFLVAYNDDLSRNPHSEAWKILAAKLNLALTDLGNDTKHRDKYINAVIEQCSNMLKQVKEGGPIDPSQLVSWLQGHAPPEAQSLYKDDPTSVVKTKGAE
ncbi:MAG TPA: hypothetical protein VFA18_17805 [Gemmataceae bacterium]|nr:hypothetical protein [Gemmataceae bacterium]